MSNSFWIWRYECFSRLSRNIVLNQHLEIQVPGGFNPLRRLLINFVNRAPVRVNGRTYHQMQNAKSF